MDNNYWSLYDYFDVWGNAEDGYEVNNQSLEFDDLYIDPNSSDADIVEYLKQIGYFANDVKMSDLEIWDDGEVIEFFRAEDMLPLCRLEKNWNR